MTGKPAARIDDNVAYGKIVTGSRTVLIGSQGGVACSVCPGGVTKGNPVNPQLGAKVLSGASELDFALPGAMPLVWQRQYSSYVNAGEGGYCGILGYGWGTPFEMRISVQAGATLLHDSQGRTITFGALASGQSIYSASEDIWLLRSGMHPGGLSQELASMTGAARFTGQQGSADPETEANQPAPIPQGQQAPLWWKGRFAWIKRDIACSGLLIFASSGSGDTLLVFAPANWQAIEAARAAVQKQQAAGKPITQNLAEVPEPDPNWILLGQMDRFGRMQRYHWAEVLGQPRITGINDGVGRHYQLHYQQILAAQDAQHYHRKGAEIGGNFFWQADSGVRLTRVYLTRDPTAPMQTAATAQPLTLVSYSYSSAGDLVQVQNRHGEVTRRFAWRNHLMVFHQDRSGPEHHYSYDRYEPGGKATEQRNQAGLDYRFDYQSLPEAEGQPRRACVVTDSLGRVETYTFQGEAGLERLVEHTRADGSTTQNRYNQYGHLTGVTDPLGRSVSMRVSPMGQLLSVQGPDGATSSQRYDEDTGLLQSTTDAAGRTTGYEYDLYGRLIQVTLADRSTEQYHYPEVDSASADPALRLNPDKPIRITDAKGGSKHIAYTSTGQTASYTDCSGQSTRYEYTRWGQMLAVINALGERARYQYNHKEQLEAIHYPDGSAEHYQYDAQGQLSQVQTGRRENAVGNDGNAPSPVSTTAALVSVEYDLWGRLVRRSHAGTSLGFAYDAAGRLTQLTNENGEHTTFAWDVMDRLARETGFDARVQSYQYDAAGQLVQSSDGWAAEQGLPAHTSHYEWTVAGQLAARHLPAGEHTPAATHRYDWSEAGELLKASVWYQMAGRAADLVQRTQAAQATTPWLQSEALIERDAAGRVIGEIQRLYKLQVPHTSQTQNDATEPALEFEHRISHRLDVLGNREASQLHGLGEVGYLLYGSGHVHGITWQGENLVDFERDALHRETGRQLTTTAVQPLIRQLSWDKAGRLSAMQWRGLEQGADLPDMLDRLPGEVVAGTLNITQSLAHVTRPPQAIVGALTSKHYHYDSLGQMVGIQSPAGMSRFVYDAAGRLTGADTPHAGLQRWKFDPTGNRLPITGPVKAPAVGESITGELNETDRLRAQQRASRQANPVSREQIAHSDYNPLQGRPVQVNGQQTPVAQKWAGNRVAYYENSEDASSGGARTHYRYDSRGNRVESVDEATGRRMQLAYDAVNQLVQVSVQEEGKHFTQRYRYDAFGRRLAKYNDLGNSEESEEAGEESGTDYFGWDGDRLVHTERFNSGNAKDGADTQQPEVIHTVYEPGSFTPLIQLRRAAKAAPDLADEIIAHMQPGIAQDALRGMLTDIGATVDKVNAGLGNLGMAADAQDFIREQLKEFEQTVNSQREERAKSVEVRHYLCDHLGTPNALVNKVGETEWAGILDIWGNIKVEYNPGKLYQPIRLSGQHQDAKSGLNYNRNRYYDREQGCYINQDPIGILSSDLNLTAYVKNPNKLIDPLGLASCNPQQEERCAQLKKQIFAKVSGLLHEFSKYDPVKDGQGGFPMKHGSGTTKPGGHYTEMTNYQGGLKNDITEYKKDCIGKDRCGGGGKWENIPRSVDELANRPIPEPVYPDNSSNLPKAAVGAAAGVTAGYVLYRVVRMIPSLFFPPSIPANAAIP